MVLYHIKIVDLKVKVLFLVMKKSTTSCERAHPSIFSPKCSCYVPKLWLKRSSKETCWNLNDDHEVSLPLLEIQDSALGVHLSLRCLNLRANDRSRGKDPVDY